MRPVLPRRALAVALAMIILLAIPAPVLASDPPRPDGPGVGGAGSPVEHRTTAKWTYMVYMSADNNLEDEAILNVNQMEVVGSTSDVNIVIQLDRTPGYDETNGDWNGTKRFYITQDVDDAKICSTELDDLGEVDMGDADELRNFVTWAITSYPAERYYLDVWGHGGGWRDGTCNDYTSNTAIDTEELGIALAQAEAGTNVTLDGIGFDQCLMAQLEVFYQIKMHADLLVGAETLIPADGYNYTRVMAPLAANPDMDAAELAELLVTAFFDEYGHDNERAHSSVDAEELDARLAPSLTWLAQSMRDKAGTYFAEMEWARDHAQTYSITDYVDLGNLTERLMERLPENETGIQQALAWVHENVTTTVVAEDHGTGRAGSTGLSIYFPDYGSSNSYTRIDMSREQGWDDFLSAHFARLDRPNTPPNVTVSSPLPGSVVGLEFTLEGTAEDADGNISAIEVKFDRGPWVTASAEEVWSANLSTHDLRPGLHRVSVRSRDDAGGYSRETQFQLMVESKGLVASIEPDTVRIYPGGATGTVLNVTTFGEEGGSVDLRVVSAPDGWMVDLPFTQTTIGPRTSALGGLLVTVPNTEAHGIFQVLLRAYMSDATLIQTFTVLEVNVTFQRPDLSVGPISFDPPEPSVGQMVEVSFNITNIGLAPTSDFRVTLQHTTLFNGSELTEGLIDEQVDSLALSETLRFNITWNASLHTHVFTAVADPALSILDLDRSDNVREASITLEGYAVYLNVWTTDIETEPGAVETVDITITNVGNIVDILLLKVVNSTHGWSAVFNRTSVYIHPLAPEEVELHIRVPLGIPGGTEELVSVRLTSYHDEDKFEDVTIRLIYPEAFDLQTTMDRPEGPVPPLGTTSFNFSILNSGNGYENYTLDYLRQTEHLFVSAVNDTLELAPGCGTTVEVFVSSLGTPVGGQTFEVRLTVRSEDDPATLATVWYNVTVMRRFEMSARPEVDEVEAFPAIAIPINLSVTNNGNYPVPIEVHVSGPTGLVDPGLIQNGTVAAGGEGTFPLLVPTKTHTLMGTYTLSFVVQEKGSPANSTSVEVEVSVLRVDGASLSVGSKPEVPLRPDEKWEFEVMLENEGNHVEIYTIDVSGLIDTVQMTIEMLDGTTVDLEEGSFEVTLPAFAVVSFGVSMTMGPDTNEGPRSMMVVFTATPANLTDDPLQAVVDVPLDIPKKDDAGAPWAWMALVTLSLAIVLLVVLVGLRRLRS